MNHLPCHLAALLLPLSLSAQDMIGVTFAGAVLHLNSQTGAVTTLANGQIGKNCLAFTNDNRLWTTVRSGTSTANFHYHLAVIDPFTGAETLPFGTLDVGDLRAMAQRDLDGNLLAIRQQTPNDELVRIDIDTGAVTVIGTTGFSGIQGLDATSAGLRAWDITAGLLLVNSNTGACSDPFPALGGPSGLQFLCSDPATQRKYVGRDALYEVNTVTGATTLVVNFAGAPDVRGAEFITSRAQPFGTPCNGAVGPVFAELVAPFGAGGTATIRSVNHAPNAIGLEVFGFGDQTYASLPLPLNLDPLLGTSGCSLLVSADITFLGIAQGNGDLIISVPIPAAGAFVQFFVQHAALEPVPGGLSFSWALRVRSGLF